MEGEGLRVGGPAEWTRRTFRCPASPTHKKETCRGVVKRHPLFLGEVVKRNPVTHSQQKSRSMNGRRLCATLFGPPSPRRTIAVSTQEAYPKQRRVVKKQGDDLDKSGCCGYDLSAGSQGYAVYSACSN